MAQALEKIEISLSEALSRQDEELDKAKEEVSSVSADVDAIDVSFWKKGDKSEANDSAQGSDEELIGDAYNDL